MNPLKLTRKSEREISHRCIWQIDLRIRKLLQLKPSQKRLLILRKEGR